MIYPGDLFDVLPTLPEKSVHCVVSSPPYWGLRDYGNPPRTFPDGWTGCLGLEPTPEMFIAHMVQAFAEVHRVLRDDGTLWLNMGDCYAAHGRMVDDVEPSKAYPKPYKNGPSIGRVAGYKPKDLIGIPWMLAFALRSWGWYLRAEIVWAKGVSFCDAYAGSVMPESVQDRPTRSHEQVFLLTKQKSYFYDAEAVREAASGTAHSRGNGLNPKALVNAPGSGVKQNSSFSAAVNELVNSRNLRTVWTISPKPFTEAHFATFPPDLVIPCIKAGTSENGVCAVCGAPWRRLVEKEPIPEDVRADFAAARERSAEDHGRTDGFTTRRPNFQRGRGETTWEPTCSCGADVVPAVVMDCFSGAGTVGAVCAGLQRRYLGVEINPAYIEIAERRIASVAPLFAEEPAS